MMATTQKDGLCPECETGRLKEIKKNLSFTYKGRSMQFSQMSVLSCPVCGHERLSERASARVDRELTDFRKSIDGLLSSHELRQIRLKLKLKIKDIARLLSLDPKTVGRYENAKKTQSGRVDILYRHILRQLEESRTEPAGKPGELASSSYFPTSREFGTTACSVQFLSSQDAPFHVKVSSMYSSRPSGATVDTTYFKPHGTREELDLAA